MSSLNRLLLLVVYVALSACAAVVYGEVASTVTVDMLGETGTGDSIEMDDFKNIADVFHNMRQDVSDKCKKELNMAKLAWKHSAHVDAKEAERMHKDEIAKLKKEVEHLRHEMIREKYNQKSITNSAMTMEEKVKEYQKQHHKFEEEKAKWHHEKQTLVKTTLNLQEKVAKLTKENSDLITNLTKCHSGGL